MYFSLCKMLLTEVSPHEPPRFAGMPVRFSFFVMALMPIPERKSSNIWRTVSASSGTIWNVPSWKR